MATCPVCGQELPWVIPLRTAAHALGISSKELDALIKRCKVAVRYRLKGRSSVERLLDLRTLCPVPPMVHRTIAHWKESA